MAKRSLKSVVALANSKLPLGWAALLLSGATLTSSLLGILRDRYLNGLYLDNYPAGIDAYTAAFTKFIFMSALTFRFPDTFFIILYILAFVNEDLLIVLVQYMFA